MKTRSLFAVILILGTLSLLSLYFGCGGGENVIAENDVDPGSIYYDDATMKLFGSEVPPFSVDPENPPADGAVSIVVNIAGATTVKLTTGGESGCGDLAAETTGANPLTVTGTVGSSGYCDLTAEIDGDPENIYEGRFEVEATDPNIPAVSLSDGDWEEEDMPTAGGSPVITAISGSTTLSCGGTNTYTVSYTGTEDVAGVILRVDGYTNGHFYAFGSGGSGSATFNISAASSCTAGTQTVHVTIIDELDNVSAEFPLTLTLRSASADLAPAFSYSATCSVSGKVTYEKFVVSHAGRSATGIMVPVRLATVKALSAVNNSTVIAQGATGLDGTYSLSFYKNPMSTNYYIAVYATSSSPNQTIVNSQRATYASTSWIIYCDNEPVKTGLDVEITESKYSGAFNIWDVMVSANNYAKTSTGSAPPQLLVLWNRGAQTVSGTSGSYYTSDTRTGLPLIAMTGEPNDPDEWDDMVIGHEYGHFVMSKYSTDDSPGGPHDGRSVPTLALSEGWATFFAGAALGRSRYIDTNGDGVAAISYSFETPPAATPLGTLNGALDGTTDEIAVNAVIWDLLDTSNETKDTLSGRSEAIWKVLTVYLKSGYAKFADRGYPGRDLIDFLDGWICLGFGNEGADNNTGLRGAAIGLMAYPTGFVDDTLASTCK